eukprot:4482671-Prymnesium_polylepis.2
MIRRRHLRRVGLLAGRERGDASATQRGRVDKCGEAGELADGVGDRLIDGRPASQVARRPPPGAARNGTLLKR